MNSEVPEAAGCWSGLRALLSTKTKRKKPTQCSPTDGTPSSSPPKAIGEHKAIHNGTELPPEYHFPPYSGTRPAPDRRKVADSDIKVPHKLPSPEAADTSDKTIDELNESLRELSLQIHGKSMNQSPVSANAGCFQTQILPRRYAHDVLTEFMEKQGFQVTRHYLADQLPGNTAWRAEFVLPDKSGKSVPVIGLNSEMDALPGIGHACGHNLIGIIGVAGAVGLKAAMEKHGISGRIILLGTPGRGIPRNGHLYDVGLRAMNLTQGTKSHYLDFRAHPGPGDSRRVENSATLALQAFTVEYHGKGAHAGAAPWEGRNALDAAFVAYSALSALRQQIHPTARLHGIIEGRDWASNGEVQKNLAWHRAAAHATSCEITFTEIDSMKDLQSNQLLSDEFGAIMASRHGYPYRPNEEIGASTDFVSRLDLTDEYWLIGSVRAMLHTVRKGTQHTLILTTAIPTTPGGGNHTPGFTAAARTQEAHERAIAVSKGLATLGLRALLDEDFLQTVSLTPKFKGDDQPTNQRRSRIVSRSTSSFD
ncbi:aminoacylase 1-like protein 2 [Rhizoctonia solani AG-1 IA]|uniref:Aminoacylase 1-like protein 2 n=1 Tax=Thanatephorus cucumeris (strain AG1-IA) TaxID=983506 RepID=L8WZZ9_THACA|nr:aminoacylase 1-like protein 2 [Rhizoctonia solani AG-1 IA]